MTLQPQGQPSAAITDDELAAYFDGQLSESAAHAVACRLTQTDRETLRHWSDQRSQIRTLADHIDAEPMPKHLMAAARQLNDAYRQAHRWRQWGGMAAGVFLAFGLGWFVRGVDQGPGAPQAIVQATPPQPHTFVVQASVAHATYVPEVRHPVEVAATQRQHLVQWLTKRLARDIKVPDFSAEGFELMGGRLLPGDEGARAQFMFERPDGLRVTLYLGAIKTDSASATPAGNAFAFRSQAGTASFYWVEDGFGYALTGPLPRHELLKLSELAYAQR